MIRAVLDANIYASAAIRPEGPPGQIIRRFLDDRAFVLILSPGIVEEVLRMLSYPKVREYIRKHLDPESWFAGLVGLAEIVAGEHRISSASRDPDDDQYIVAAIEGRAKFIVAGDADLLSLKEHEHIRIISPRTFLDLLTAA